MDEQAEQPVQTDKARDVDYREIKPPKKKRNVLFLIIGALILLGLIGAGFYFFNKSDNKEASSSSNSETKQSTVSATKELDSCADAEKQDFVNTKQGYHTCYPKGWQSKELKVSGLVVGFDPKQVDEATPGVITVAINDKSEALAIQDISNETSKFAYGPVNVDGIKGTQVTFTRLKSDSLSTAYPQGIYSVVTKFERTYTIGLNSTDADFETNKVLYETFLSDFKFIEDTASPPWSESRNILVNFPWAGDSITSPVEVSGEAIAFEGVVNIRIKDSANHTLEETTTQARSGQERSAFKASVTFDKPTTKKGTIEVYTQSAKDGSEQDKVTVEVVFP